MGVKVRLNPADLIVRGGERCEGLLNRSEDGLNSN